MQEPSTAMRASPVREGERMAILDMLRGFALFGILTVNMYLFAGPLQRLYVGLGLADRPALDQLADWLVAFFATGKFYTLFSLLFGLGFVLFIDRARAAGRPAVPLFLRRLLALFAFGVVHAVLIWIGDILTTYAVIGLILMLFAWVKRPRTLLIWAITIFSLSVLGLAAFTGVIALSAAVPEARATVEAGLAQGQIDAQAEADRAVAIYRSGDVAAIIEQRLRELGQMSAYAALSFPSILTMFLLGAYLGRRGVFRDLEAHRPLFRRMFLWGLIVGVPTNALYATWVWTTPLEAGDLTVQIGASLMGAIGQPALCLAYVGGLSLLAGNPRWGRWLGALAPVGRMALTNYLLQSVLATMIFYGYGLGLYGQVGTVAGLGIAVAIYALLIPLSHLWLSRFRYGPAEWLWRTLTYLRPQPMRYAGRAADPADRLEHGAAG